MYRLCPCSSPLCGPYHLPPKSSLRATLFPRFSSAITPFLRFRSSPILSSPPSLRGSSSSSWAWARRATTGAEHVPGGDSLAWVQREGLHEQVDAVGADGAEEAHEVVLPLGRLFFGDGVAREAGDAGPVVLGGRADGLADDGDLLDLCVGGHVGVAHDELGEDAADGPDVDGARVVLGAEEKLRGPVPARDDLGGH